jgi:hypothetical protein
MMRAFGSKIFVKGKHVRVALSRFAMEVTYPIYPDLATPHQPLLS